jgi:hypothetical protein
MNCVLLSAAGRERPHPCRKLYRETVGDEPLSPEQVAKEYNLPVEAIHYCEQTRELLDAERAREQASIEARRVDYWPHAPETPDSPDEYLPG